MSPEQIRCPPAAPEDRRRTFTPADYYNYYKSLKHESANPVRDARRKVKVAGLAGSKAPREVWLRHPLSTGSKTSTEQALMVSILYACHEGLLNKHYSYNSCSASSSWLCSVGCMEPWQSPSAKTSGCEFLRTDFLDDDKISRFSGCRCTTATSLVIRNYTVPLHIRDIHYR